VCGRVGSNADHNVYSWQRLCTALLFAAITACSSGNDHKNSKAPPPSHDTTIGLPPTMTTTPEATADGWLTSTPEAQGMDGPALLAALTSVQDGAYPKVDSVVIIRNDRLIAEGYFNGFGREILHDFRSASKSITSALIGIAISQGVLSVEEPLNDFYRLDAHLNPDPRKAGIRVFDLLNMSSGLTCDDWDSDSIGNEQNMYFSPDWIAFTLDLPMAANPGERSSYCSAGAILLGDILSMRTGMALDDYANTYLLQPMGIEKALWRRSPDGHATGGGGMRLRPRDAAKFGQLYLDKGMWQGQRIVPENWVDESRRSFTTLNDDGYGLLWWKHKVAIRGKTEAAFSAEGNGGNFIFVFPEENLVVVFTGSNYFMESNYNSDLIRQPFEMLERRILPALQ
jgi:CubicO group peptidase (beta-lactamase class C family)